MATLWLLRHLKSAWDVPGQPDFERGLAPRGLKAGPLVAAHLTRRGVMPELILCSAARRTRATLDLVGGRWQRVDTCIEAGLYEASAEDLLRRLQAVAGGRGGVLLIGHNPGLERLATLLCGGRGEAAALRRLAEKFPTGALATLAFDGTAWRDLAAGSCRLNEYVRPSDVQNQTDVCTVTPCEINQK